MKDSVDTINKNNGVLIYIIYVCMKKMSIFLMILALGVSSFAPLVAAQENEGMRQEIKDKKELFREEAKEKMNTLKGELKEGRKDLREEIKSMRPVRPLAVTLKGSLLEVKNQTTSTAQLVVQVTRLLTNKNVPASSTIWYPAVSTTITVNVDSRSKIVRLYGGKSSVNELVVGDVLHITGQTVTSTQGVMLAQTVKDESIHELERSLNGTIDSLNAANSTFVLRSMNSSTVMVSLAPGAKIMIKGVTTTTFADLKVGDKVQVRGVINTRIKAVTAKQIKVIRSR